MGGNYAAPPGNAALSRIPRGISGPFKKGNAVLRSHPPRWRINLYTASGNQAKEPSPKHIEGSKRRRIRQPLFYTYTRFQIRDAFKRAIFPPRIRENLGRRRGEEEEGEGLGLGSGNQTAIAIFISARYFRDFDPRRSSFSPRLNAAGKVNRVDERLPRLFHDTPSLLEIRFASEDVVLRRKKKSERIE